MRLICWRKHSWQRLLGLSHDRCGSSIYYPCKLLQLRTSYRNAIYGAAHANSQLTDTLPAELAIVILNYRTPDLVSQCLLSIAPEHNSYSVSVVVVDNDSGDDSAETIEKQIIDNNWSGWARLVRSDSNKGFAGGNNLGLDFVKDAPFVLLLNSDTIVQPGCLTHCLRVIKSNPRIGALSCKLLNSDGSIQNVARKFPNPLFLTLSALGLPWRWPRLFGWADIQDFNWNRDTVSRPVDWLGGAFLMVPRTVLEKIGPLDEEFFFYGEDVEFCHRIRKAGYLCWYEAAVATTHLGGGSSDVTRLPKAQQNQHRWNARYLEQRKLYGRWAELLLRCVDSMVSGLRSIKQALLPKG